MVLRLGGGQEEGTPGPSQTSIPSLDELRATICAIPGMRVRELGDGGIPSTSVKYPTTLFFLTPHNVILPKPVRPFLASKHSGTKQMIKELATLADRITPLLQNSAAKWAPTQESECYGSIREIYFPIWLNKQQIGTRITYEKERIELAPELGGRRYTVRRPTVQPITRLTYLVLLPDAYIMQEAMRRKVGSDGTYHFMMPVTAYEEYLESKKELGYWA